VLSACQIFTFLVATTLVVISGAYAVRSLSSDSDYPEKIGALHRRLFDALLRRDISMLEQNTSANSIIVDPRGQVMTRGQFLTELSSGALRYDSIGVDNISLHVYGDTVVETGYCLVTGKHNERDKGGQFRYSAIFVKGQEHWQAVNLQLTRLNAEGESDQ